VRILVVDDEADIRTLIRIILEPDGVDVVEAADAAEALQLCDDPDLGVVLLDIGLGATSGLEVLSTLQERHPHLPVIMLSAESAEDDRVQALESGAHDYIIKPFSNRELRARVLAAGRPRPAASATGSAAGSPDRLPWTGNSISKVPSVIVAGDQVAQANDAALELLAARHGSEVLGKHFLEFVAPESVAASRRRQQDAISGDWPRPENITLRRVDGLTVDVEVASLPVIWEGEPATQITLWDVSSAPDDLQAMAVGVQSAIADAVIVTDMRLTVRSFNLAAEDLYGWTESEALGRHISELLGWDPDSDVGRQAEEAFASYGRWHGELTEHRKDGEPLRVRSSATLVRDRSGQPIGVVTVNRRVSDYSFAPAPPLKTVEEADVDIRRGVVAGEFRVFYQPVVRLDTGAWAGVEALVRWQHPTRGLLQPAAFIDLAERSGAIVDLGLFVLEEACQQWSRWQADGLDLHVAVNLSGRQLADPDLAARVASATAAASMPPGELWLEVTETSLVEDLDQAERALRRLADEGAHVSIDDFGTGWASLTYLRRFPVTSLKIDRVFVEGLGAGGNDDAIVSSIISLGAELGLDVVAEGIETPQQAARLIELGCVLGQGFLYARPAPAADLRNPCPPRRRRLRRDRHRVR
jgi:PAS domain S-box-containing protein